MHSNYAKYIYERLGHITIEDDTGFITIEQNYPDYAYFIDIYVVPEHRRKGAGRALTNKAVEWAKANGYKKVVGSVKPTANGATYSMKCMLEYGFSLDSCNSQLIYLYKNI